MCMKFASHYLCHVFICVRPPVLDLNYVKSFQAKLIDYTTM